MIGGQQSIAFDQLDLVDRQAEFFRRNLRESGAQAGAQIHLARIDCRRAIGVEREISIDLCRINRLGGDAALRLHMRGEGNGNEESARALQKIAARCVHVHPRVPPAFTTAATMRSCVPQRQRFWASASLTCAAVGFGFFSSKAAPDITMPLVQ